METKNFDDLKANPKNPRTISKHDFEKLVQSIREFGDLSGIVFNITTGQLVGGHQRIEAFKKLSGEKRVIIDNRFDTPNKHGTVAIGHVELDGELYKYREVEWPLEREIAANVAANRIQGEFDLDLLAEANYFLNEQSPDLLGLTGQTKTEIDSLLDAVGAGSNPEDDEAPPVDDAQPAVSHLGEIYQLGRHRLMCGDALLDAPKLLENKKADMVFTDPPWNVGIGLATDPALNHRTREGLQNDNIPQEEFDDFVNNFSGVYANYCKGDFYCVLGAHQWGLLDSTLKNNNFHWSATIIWVKQHFVFGQANYHRKYEPIWYGWHSSQKSTFNGDRTTDDVWEVDRPMRSEEHPTMKPIALIERALINSSQRGDIILDLFGGSGSTLIAADKLDRTCYMMELDPRYCDVIRKRYAKLHDHETDWQDFTPVINEAANEPTTPTNVAQTS